MTVRVHALIDGLGCGGAELLLAELAAVAPAAGIELTVATLAPELAGDNPAADRLRRAGVEPTFLSISGLVNPRGVGVLRRHLRSVAPDVLHTHLGYADFLGGIAGRSLGLPVVSTVHGTDWGGDLRARTKDRLMALARRHCAERVIAVSAAAREVYLRTGWDRPERLVTVHNGIAGPGSAVSRDSARAALGLGADDQVLMMISRLRPEKAHDVAIAALERLTGDFPRTRLVIVGNGPEEERIAALAAPLGDRVVMAGYHEEVFSVLPAADVLLHPSRHEAFPTTLLEALAAGVPVIASDVGGIPEIVRDGETGLLIAAPPDPEVLSAAVAGLLGDTGRRAAMAERGRATFAEAYSAAAWAERLAALYADVRRH
jgi:glycosyltransferase involved in cell wall biosynthesis